MTNTGTTEPWKRGPGVNDLARELAWLPGVAQRLLAVHVSDGRGRCRGCTTPGTGAPGAAWPCALHFYADAAARIAHWHGIAEAPVTIG